MKRKLTPQDIKTLRYQCRKGYILPVLFFIIASAGAYLLLNKWVIIEGKVIASQQFIITLLVIAILAVFISYLMIGKYLADIRRKEKKVVEKIVQKKEQNKDFEAGSGTLYVGQKMNEYDTYNIIVDNTRYEVGPELYEKCREGGKVAFHYGPKSNYLIKIEAAE